MGREMAMESNSCFRGCCTSERIPLHLPPQSFSLLAPIAKGSESTVFEALLNGRRVAAKKPVLSTADDIDKYHRQLQLLCKLDHPGLVKLIAAHARPPSYLLFFEFYESPNLAEKLHIEEWSPTTHEALVITTEIARALKYLHNQGIVHRDIKPANILLDADLHPRVADFGLAAYQRDLKCMSAENWRSSGKPTGGFHKKNMVGTLIYMAPEILKKDVHTEKSDVYSYAITINELLTGVVPFTDLRTEAQAHTVLEVNYTEQQLTAAISHGLRPLCASSESGVPTSLFQLIEKCWAPNPLDRPHFVDIVEELNSIVIHDEKTRESVKDVSTSSDVLFQNTNGHCKNYMEELNWYSQGERMSKKIQLVDSQFDLWAGFVKDDHVYEPTLSWGSFATCGRRESMEDTHFMLPKFCEKDDIHLFGIFDGHRGSAAAEFSSQALPGYLQTLCSTSCPSEALVNAFVKTDSEFRKELIHQRNLKRVAQKEWHPGCTAMIALIVQNKLFIANAGDCRAILCHRGNPIPLSKDHVASCPEERDRVVKQGMEVNWKVDTWRIGPAALQVTRSIGDDDLKPAVTAEPEITETSLSADDEYLVMASDGLWDMISNEDVISIIRDTVKEPSMCAKRLATEAATRGSKDNITVIVVFLHPVSTAERVY
ncbi:protein kinase family protein / protein phosphatase 2C (PP2C) family protein [Wolffia australiana]